MSMCCSVPLTCLICGNRHIYDITYGVQWDIYYIYGVKMLEIYIYIGTNIFENPGRSRYGVRRTNTVPGGLPDRTRGPVHSSKVSP